jgi:hypothetical protein
MMKNLLQELRRSLYDGNNLMITGPSGLGKTHVGRSLAATGVSVFSADSYGHLDEKGHWVIDDDRMVADFKKHSGKQGFLIEGVADNLAQVLPWVDAVIIPDPGIDAFRKFQKAKVEDFDPSGMPGSENAEKVKKKWTKHWADAANASPSAYRKILTDAVELWEKKKTMFSTPLNYEVLLMPYTPQINGRIKGWA